MQCGAFSLLVLWTLSVAVHRAFANKCETTPPCSGSPPFYCQADQCKYVSGCSGAKDAAAGVLEALNDYRTKATLGTLFVAPEPAKVTTPSAPTTTPATTATTTTPKAAARRKRQAAKAANLYTLSYDDELSFIAQCHAMQCSGAPLADTCFDGAQTASMLVFDSVDAMKTTLAAEVQKVVTEGFEAWNTAEAAPTSTPNLYHVVNGMVKFVGCATSAGDSGSKLYCMLGPKASGIPIIAEGTCTEAQCAAAARTNVFEKPFEIPETAEEVTEMVEVATNATTGGTRRLAPTPTLHGFVVVPFVLSLF